MLITPEPSAIAPRIQNSNDLYRMKETGDFIYLRIPFGPIGNSQSNMNTEFKNILLCCAPKIEVKSISCVFDIFHNTIRHYVRMYEESGIPAEKMSGLSDLRLQELFAFFVHALYQWDTLCLCSDWRENLNPSLLFTLYHDHEYQDSQLYSAIFLPQLKNPALLLLKAPGLSLFFLLRARRNCALIRNILR